MITTSFISFKYKSFQEDFRSLRHFHFLNMVWDQDFKSALNVTLRCSDFKEVHWDLIFENKYKQTYKQGVEDFFSLANNWKVQDTFMKKSRLHDTHNYNCTKKMIAGYLWNLTKLLWDPKVVKHHLLRLRLWFSITFYLNQFTL